MTVHGQPPAVPCLAPLPGPWRRAWWTRRRRRLAALALLWSVLALLIVLLWKEIQSRLSLRSAPQTKSLLKPRDPLQFVTNPVAEHELPRDSLRLLALDELEPKAGRRTILNQPLAIDVAEGLEYDIRASTLAHWHTLQNAIVSTVLVHEDFSKHRRQNKHHVKEDPRVTCSFVSRQGTLAMGRAKVSFAAEENFGLDRGGLNLKHAIADGFVSGRFVARLEIRTMFVTCLLNDTAVDKSAGHLRLSVTEAVQDRDIQVELPVQALPREPLTQESSPVVCSRVMAGPIDGLALRLFVENNLLSGLSHTVVYETGLSFFSHRQVLQPLIDDGSLIIVDIRNSLQDMYQVDASSILAHVKGEGQWLSRIDCLNRMRPLNPSWIINLDFDEFPIPGSEADASERLVDILHAKPPPPKGPSVLYFDVVQPEVAQCFAHDSSGLQFREAARDAELSEIYVLQKFAHRPMVDKDQLKIHRMKSKVTMLGAGNRRHVAKSVFVPRTSHLFFHHRCINEAIAERYAGASNVSALGPVRK